MLYVKNPKLILMMQFIQTCGNRISDRVPEVTLYQKFKNGWLAFLGPNKRDSLEGEET